MNDKELLQPKGITSAELKELVAEYQVRGGVITVCPPGVALNFCASALSDTTEGVKKRFKVIRKKKK